jgi:hypothetical protein
MPRMNMRDLALRAQVSGLHPLRVRNMKFAVRRGNSVEPALPALRIRRTLHPSVTSASVTSMKRTVRAPAP